MCLTWKYIFAAITSVGSVAIAATLLYLICTRKRDIEHRKYIVDRDYRNLLLNNTIGVRNTLSDMFAKLQFNKTHLMKKDDVIVSLNKYSQIVSMVDNLSEDYPLINQHDIHILLREYSKAVYYSSEFPLSHIVNIRVLSIIMHLYKKIHIRYSVISKPTPEEFNKYALSMSKYNNLFNKGIEFVLTNMMIILRIPQDGLHEVSREECERSKHMFSELNIEHTAGFDIKYEVFIKYLKNERIINFLNSLERKMKDINDILNNV